MPGSPNSLIIGKIVDFAKEVSTAQANQKDSQFKQGVKSGQEK